MVLMTCPSTSGVPSAQGSGMKVTKGIHVHSAQIPNPENDRPGRVPGRLGRQPPDHQSGRRQRDALRLRRGTGTERARRALRRPRSHPGRGGGSPHLGRSLPSGRGRCHRHACQRTTRAAGGEEVQDAVNDGEGVGYEHTIVGHVSNVTYGICRNC